MSCHVNTVKEAGKNILITIKKTQPDKILLRILSTIITITIFTFQVDKKAHHTRK